MSILPLLRLPEELVQDRHLDDRCRRESLRGPDLQGRSGLQVLHRKAEDAVQGALDRVDSPLELIPQGGLLGRQLAREEHRPGGEADGGGQGSLSHSAFHTLSYLTIPVGPIATPCKRAR